MCSSSGHRALFRAAATFSLACVLIGITLGAGKAVAAAVEEGAVLKEAITASRAGKNLAAANAASAYERGFRSQDGLIVCDNGTDAQAKRLDSRGALQIVSATELRRGDLVVVEAGDLIPGDGDVIEGP